MQLYLHITPNAKSNELSIYGQDLYGNTVYKCKLAAKPVDGEANKALIAYLAEFLDIPKRLISLERGATSRQKVLYIDYDQQHIGSKLSSLSSQD